MYIPSVMKKTMNKFFYDKEVFVLDTITSTDIEGGVTYDGTVTKDSFYGNVSFSNSKVIQEEYGLDYDIDISITADYTLLKHNDLIKYDDVTYRVTDILPSDSHLLIVGVKWQQVA